MNKRKSFGRRPYDLNRGMMIIAYAIVTLIAFAWGALWGWIARGCV
jgi:hypothetical protein